MCWDSHCVQAFPCPCTAKRFCWSVMVERLSAHRALWHHNPPHPAAPHFATYLTAASKSRHCLLPSALQVMCADIALCAVMHRHCCVLFHFKLDGGEAVCACAHAALQLTTCQPLAQPPGAFPSGEGHCMLPCHRGTGVPACMLHAANCRLHALMRVLNPVVGICFCTVHACAHATIGAVGTPRLHALTESGHAAWRQLAAVVARSMCD